MAFWHRAHSSTLFALLIPGLTPFSIEIKWGVRNCHATREHRKKTIFTSIVYGTTRCFHSQNQSLLQFTRVISRGSTVRYGTVLSHKLIIKLVTVPCHNLTLSFFLLSYNDGIRSVYVCVICSERIVPPWPSYTHSPFLSLSLSLKICYLSLSYCRNVREHVADTMVLP